MELPHLPPDLLDRARTSIERQGYCIFDAATMTRLLARAGVTHAAKEEMLKEFAQACGAAFETNPHFTSARFVKIPREQKCECES